jgi:hypothetical protein
MFSAATKSAHPAGGVTYIEDVFSTYLYTGTGASQTINNGIDLAGKGGLVFQKERTGNYADGWFWFDTVRGINKNIRSNNANPEVTTSNSLTAFNSNGFNIGANLNFTGSDYCTWTFREQPKFFDVVTYTGNGTAGRTVSHSLGSVPGMIIIKDLDIGLNWAVYHRSIPNTDYLRLNLTDAKVTNTAIWNSTTPSSTTFTLGSSGNVNSSGTNYVAYVFAHDAGGFGTTGTDNVISCGSFTTDGSGNATVNLGYEPQYVLVKGSSAANDWIIQDVMRGMSYTNSRWLYANTTDAEISSSPILKPTATGFISENGNLNTSTTYIYMAIRRPMAVPTDATTVYKPIYVSSSPSDYDVTFTGLSYVDHIISFKDAVVGGTYNAPIWNDRLRGFPINMAATTWVNNPGLDSSSTVAEANGTNPSSTNYLSGVTMNRAVWGGGWTGYTGVFHGFKRAAGFFDEVCYTGTGSGTNQTHNLGVIPELKIIKRRSASADWIVGGSIISGVGGRANNIILNSTAALSVNSTYWDAADTSTTFSVRAGNGMSDASGSTYVAYLFATCAGVSKVGSYTGNGTTQAISCGFTGGARFVLIKRTDSTGGWYVYDTARGMTLLTDPYLQLNSTAAESATLGSVITTAGGFTVDATILAAINTNAASYIFLAIA